MPPKKLGHVVLKLPDLERAEAFYTEVVGLRVTGRRPGRMVSFGVPGNDDSHDLAVWTVGPDAPGAQPRQLGLFHVAGQVERPEDLEPLYRHRLAKGVTVHGSQDHGVNESIYFEDPDGNMLEFTSERPRAAWPSGQNPFAGRKPLPFAARA